MIVSESEANRFTALMRTGQIAFIKGERRKAHQYWREAATLDPYDEEVWEKLLAVVETNADRRACLENILAINPKNEWAAHQVAALAAHRDGTSPARPADWSRLRRVLVFAGILVKYGLLGVALGLLISAVVQGVGL